MLLLQVLLPHPLLPHPLLLHLLLLLLLLLHHPLLHLLRSSVLAVVVQQALRTTTEWRSMATPMSRHSGVIEKRG